MRLGIRFQLLLPLVTLMAGVVGMSVWTALSSVERARRQIENQLDTVAATVGSVTFPLNPSTLKLMKGMSGADFLLCDAHRRPILDDKNQPMTTLPAVPASLPEPAAGDEHPLGSRVEVAGAVYFCRGVALRHDVSANLTLYIFYSESLWRDALWQAIRPALVVGVIGGIVAIGLTVAVTQHLTRRIQELERRTRLIAAGDFSPMSLPRRDDELRDLGQSVNDMAQRLADYRETATRTERLRLLGQVSGGLAHQLRNGVAGARLAVQLHAKECSGKADGETLDVALRQLALMEMHLKRFLDLGKTIELRREACDLRTLVAEAAALVGPQCRHAAIDLCVLPGEGPLIVSADGGQLSQLLVNIMTNAAEAAGPDGRVEIRSGIAATGLAWIEVIDSGPGPSKEIADRLFEPFVTGKPEGVGLGLAVARQVVEAHAGTIAWSRRPEGTCFRIELPA
ncbi:MAG: HAMP domain-containing histidine kinase [Planctomycetes bacterium]|nr:HAMP domain-containing histidine kinase [Planctomycetota bacterium]